MAGSGASSALWYLTRGTGAVALVLLSAGVALGVANLRRTSVAGLPRFVLSAVHRTASLLGLAFVAVHVVTSVLDPFAPIRLIDAVVPFVSAYRPLWLGLGAVAADLLIAVALTSVLRHRFGYRAWRATHWLAYVCWPIALVHALGTGSDGAASWMLWLTAGCVLAVLAAVWTRIAYGWPGHVGPRTSALVLSIAAPIALLAWLPSGPLAPDWAKRAGTPTSLLATGTRVSVAATAGASSVTPAAFTAPVSGRVSQSPLAGGLVQLDLRLTLAGRSLNALNIRIDGQPVTGGGVQMASSTVTFGSSSDPAAYAGRVTGLAGADIRASVTGARGGLILRARLRIDPASGAVTGALAAQPASSGQPGEGNE